MTLKNDSQVCFIDDDADIRQAIKQTLLLESMSVECFADGASALASLSQSFEGVILCDYNMPLMDGLEVMARVQAIDSAIPVIILTGQGDISTAVLAMQQGAYDFIEKPFVHDALMELLRHAIEKRALALENRRLKAQLRKHRTPGPRLLGESAKMQRLLDTVDPLLDVSVNLLLFGETGSGKDAIARYIHENSARRSFNYVAINCGGMPEQLIESELFGHESGAFTGASKQRTGKFEHAHKGTLLLDEIESMPLALQVKLLRVLEERSVERLGSNTSTALDLRILTATKSDLRAMSERGEFRSDLYYRLNVVQIDVPPLRARSEDVPLLFHHFALIAAARYDLETVPLDAGQAGLLMQRKWPGNVRELRNLAERYVLQGPGALDSDGDMSVIDISARQTLGEMTESFERATIMAALNSCHGSIKGTMHQLGTPRKTLYDKMKKYGLDKANFKD